LGRSTAWARKQDRLATGRPASTGLACGIGGQLAGISAGQRHNPQVRGPLVGFQIDIHGGEEDPFVVRGDRGTADALKSHHVIEGKWPLARCTFGLSNTMANYRGDE